VSESKQLAQLAKLLGQKSLTTSATDRKTLPTPSVVRRQSVIRRQIVVDDEKRVETGEENRRKFENGFKPFQERIWSRCFTKLFVFATDGGLNKLECLSLKTK